MTLTQETSRRVSISALPNDNEQNRQSSGLLQARQLTPYHDHTRNHLSYVPNSFIHIGQTPHNSYAPGAIGGAASPRHIGNMPLSQAGAGPLQPSLIAHRLRALRNARPREDQENCNGEQSPEASLTYRPKLIDTPSGVQQITDKLEKEGFDRGTPVR
jgi:hypothetical protein